MRHLFLHCVSKHTRPDKKLLILCVYVCACFVVFLSSRVPMDRKGRTQERFPGSSVWKCLIVGDLVPQHLSFLLCPVFVLHRLGNRFPLYLEFVTDQEKAKSVIKHGNVI